MMELTLLLFKSLGYNVISPISDVTYEKLKAILKEFTEMEHGESAFNKYSELDDQNDSDCEQDILATCDMIHLSV